MIMFQDLFLRSGTAAHPEIRAALLSCAAPPWRHDPGREREVGRLAGDDVDIVVFSRSAGDGIAASSLFLWSRETGYEVTNIVPSETGSLGEGGYNAVLRDFVDRVAQAASVRAGFRIETTSGEQTVEDWLPEGAAAALRHFSASANKSTGSAHPSDRTRWQAFLIAVHDAGSPLGAELLKRWLVEDGWSEDEALDLAIEYEFGLSLLGAYDRGGT